MSDKKKTYKEINGTTRVGDFLRKIGKPETLNKVLTVVGNAVTGDWGEVVDVITSSTELNEKDKELALKEIERDIVEQQEITKRWEADSHSDSWLSKNVRPMILTYLVLSTSVVMILDSASVLEVKEHWVSLITSLLLTTIGAYFGLREVGKYVDKRYK